MRSVSLYPVLKVTIVDSFDGYDPTAQLHLNPVFMLLPKHTPRILQVFKGASNRLSTRDLSALVFLLHKNRLLSIHRK